MSYDDKIELIANDLVEFVTREINKEFYDKIRKQKRHCDFTEAYYKIYKTHFGDLIDHRIYDKVSVLGGCIYCLFKSICESSIDPGEMNTIMEKYIRLQVTTMNLWSC